MSLHPLKTLLQLPSAGPPEYTADCRLQAFVRWLGLRIRWVASVTNIGTGNSFGDSLYDCGLLVVPSRLRAETYVHELCHAAVARGVRPRRWRKLTNYGCVADAEEVRACHLQFFLLDRWGIWDEYTRDRGPGILCDYSFDMDIDYKDDEDRVRQLRNLWKHVVNRGSRCAKRLRLPIEKFENPVDTQPSRGMIVVQP